MPQGQLAQVLREVLKPRDARLLVGPETIDDAGVVVLGRGEGLPAGVELHLVQTVDYFPPVVDDPYLYGAIAAANSMSDVYAMGGRVFSVLNLAGFPKDFPQDWMAEIFRGGFDKVAEAGAIVAGGHTVQSPEAQFGFAVTGLVERARLTSNAGAKVGDRLYLTKSLGMGTLTTCAMRGKLDLAGLLPAAHQMATLNAAAAEAMGAAGAHACTDITGFGLAGHAHNIGAASGVCLKLDLAAVPVFPGAYELAAAGGTSGASKRGRAGLAATVRLAADVDATRVAIAFDAETSGGLLIVVAPERAAALERELVAREQLVAPVGEVVALDGAFVELA
ncbi:MAG: selenide, water dikinase SelD [Planctomycetes bacterium]|nr:selenide, water dikinase SelD [Planctomycetota bacterium]